MYGKENFDFPLVGIYINPDSMDTSMEVSRMILQLKGTPKLSKTKACRVLLWSRFSKSFLLPPCF